LIRKKKGFPYSGFLDNLQAYYESKKFEDFFIIMRQIPSICIDFKYDFVNECAWYSKPDSWNQLHLQEAEYQPEVLEERGSELERQLWISCHGLRERCQLFYRERIQEAKKTREPANFPFEYR
jgi:hypothetical protein